MSITSFRAKLEKQGVSTELTDPSVWLTTGNYALNHALTGNPRKGLPNGRTVCVWGTQGTGKTFLACSFARQAQDQGYLVVYIDTEKSLSLSYYHNMGIDVDKNRFIFVQIKTLEGLTDAIAALLSELNEVQKICIVVDSLTNCRPEIESNAFNKGEIKADQGQKAKRAKVFVSNMNSIIGDRDWFFIYTCHAYVNQNLLNGMGPYIMSGGEGIGFYPSMAILCTKLKLKEGDEVIGIRMRLEITKTRFYRLGTKIEISLIWGVGMQPYDGFADLAAKQGILHRSGGWLEFQNEKFRESEISSRFQAILDQFPDSAPKDLGL